MTARPWDFLNPNTEYADEDLIEKRMNICKSCEYFFHPTGQCIKCGCFMKGKTTMKSATCPIEKW